MNFSRITGLRSALLIAVCMPLLFFARTLHAQENPLFKVDETVTRFAFSGDGRMAFSVRHVFSEKKIQLQRDDIWIAERDGKKRRIFQGDKFARGAMPFSYAVRGLRWSADSTKLTIELATSEMINDDGDTREGVGTLLLDDAGREISIAGGDSLIIGATDAAWLADGSMLAYFTEEKKNAATSPQPGATETPKEIAPLERSFSMQRVNVVTGASTALFPGHVFSAITWTARRDAAIAIERSPGTMLHPRLVELDPANNASHDLATLDGYAGGLTISPAGKTIAYWVDNGQLEFRDLNAPNLVARVRIALGILAWSGDGGRLLVKRGPVIRSGDLVWVALPELANVADGVTPQTVETLPQAILHDLEFRQFEISQDGKILAVVEPGKRNLLVYALP
jgi:hypothetical protein